jgi:hypothetical protein
MGYSADQKKTYMFRIPESNIFLIANYVVLKIRFLENRGINLNASPKWRNADFVRCHVEQD